MKSKRITPLPSPETKWAGQEIFTERDTAAFLRLSHRTLQALRVRGGGPAFIKLGKTVRYVKADLLQWIEVNRHSSTSSYE